MMMMMMIMMMMMLMTVKASDDRATAVQNASYISHESRHVWSKP